MSLHDKLHELFLLDQQVRGMQGRLANAQNRLKAQQAKMDQLKQQRQEVADQVKAAQVQSSSLEHQAKGVEDRITQLRTQLNSVTNNKEYSTLLVEVNTQKLEQGNLEEQALEQMGEVDRLKEQLAAIDEDIAARQRLFENAKADSAECHTEVDQKLEELSAQRAVAEENIPPAARTEFNRVANIHDGETMAVVVEGNRRAKEYTCGGCYLNIPIERVNALMTSDTEIVGCPCCGRILFLDQEVKSSIAPK